MDNSQNISYAARLQAALLAENNTKVQEIMTDMLTDWSIRTNQLLLGTFYDDLPFYAAGLKILSESLRAQMSDGEKKSMDVWSNTLGVVTFQP